MAGSDGGEWSRDRVERRLMHARETIEAVRRLRGVATRPEDVVGLHELHARHERELGHLDAAGRSEARARAAKRRPER